jgi:hypothetical protein
MTRPWAAIARATSAALSPGQKNSPFVAMSASSTSARGRNEYWGCADRWLKLMRSIGASFYRLCVTLRRRLGPAVIDEYATALDRNRIGTNPQFRIDDAMSRAKIEGPAMSRAGNQHAVGNPVLAESLAGFYLRPHQAPGKCLGLVGADVA